MKMSVPTNSAGPSLSNATVDTRENLNSLPSVNVYLRLKSNLSKTLSDQVDEEAYVIVNPTTLSTKCQSFHSNSKSKEAPRYEVPTKKFTFTNIFDPSTSQADLFDSCIRDQIVDFLRGKNATIMTYGVSNSGKTYTMYGTSTSPGVIPRSIDFIFSTINCTSCPWYKPAGDGVRILDDHDRRQELDSSNRIIETSVINEDRWEEAKRLFENSVPSAEGSEERKNVMDGATLSVWFSFAEIYNENVYDLFSSDNTVQRVNCLQAVHVTTALEAFRLLALGRSRMNVASTMMNPNSSRSHTVLIIKLLEYRNEDPPFKVRVSTLSFYDLAGSSRNNWGEGGSGARQAESKSINNSLLVLGRCLTIIRDQKRVPNGIMRLPLRESTLTTVLQAPLSGQEEMSFIVNVDQAPEVFAETQNVLNFSAVAMQIRPGLSKELRRNLTSEMTSRSPKMSSILDVIPLPSLGSTPEKLSSIDPEENKTLKEHNEMLSRELEALKAALRDYESSSDFEKRPESSNTLPCTIPGNDNLVNDFKELKGKNEMLSERLEAFENDRLKRESEARSLEKKSQSSNTLPCRVVDNDEFIDPEEFAELRERNRILSEKLEALEVDRSNHQCVTRSVEKKSQSSNTLPCRVVDNDQFIDPEEFAELREKNRILSEKLEALEVDRSNHQCVTRSVEKKSQSSNTLPCRIVNDEDFIDSEEFLKLQEKNQTLFERLEAFEADRLNREFEIRQELMNQYSAVIQDLEDTWKKRAQEIEDQERDFQKWSVNQVEVFYKKRIDSIMRNNKRKRVDDDGDSDENQEAYEQLEAKNAQITSEVVVLRDAVKKLQKENEVISMQRNKYNLEISSMEKELKELHELTSAHFPILLSNFKDSECGPTRVVDKLKSVIDGKIRAIEILKKDLTETRSDYDRVSSELLITGRELRETKLMLNDGLTKMRELEDEFVQKTNYIRSLECQLQAQEKHLPRIPQTRINHDKRLSVGEKSISDSGRGYSIASDDFFCTDEVVDTMFVTQAHVDIKMETNYNCPEGKPSRKNFSNGSDADCRSYLENSSGTFRSSDGSVKDDSGIGSFNRSRRSTSVTDSIRVYETEERCTQTFSLDRDPLIDAIEHANKNYENLKMHRLQETLRVEELSEQLRNTNETMRSLKAVIDISKAEILNYKEKLTSREEELQRLDRTNSVITMEYNELLKLIATKSEDYERKISELTGILSVREENEHRNSKCVEDYLLRRTAYLESQLSLLRTQLEESYVACDTEHISKIERLEKELLSKNSQLNEIDRQLAETQQDLLRVQELHEKVNEFERIIEKCQQEKSDYRGGLRERLETQSILEAKLKALSTRMQERDNELGELSAEISNVKCLSVANSEKANDLRKKIIESKQVVRVTKEELARSEELRENIEKTSKREIASLRQRFAAFEKNATFLNEIRASNREKQEEVDRLRLQLRESQREMSLFAEQRDATIKNYECLVNQLRGEVEKREDQLLKLEKLFQPKPRESSKFSSGMRPKFKTESSSRANDSDSQTESDTYTNSEQQCLCRTPMKNIKLGGNMAGWMRVRKVNGKTQLLGRRNERRTGFSNLEENHLECWESDSEEYS